MVDINKKWKEELIELVKKADIKDSSHDFLHLIRVKNNAMQIGKMEKADLSQ